MSVVGKPIAVYAGDEELGIELLAMWRVPNGALGAFRRGQIFPLLLSGSIDISETFYTPDVCLPVYDRPIDGPAISWTLGADDPPLLLVQGSEGGRDALFAAIEVAGGRIRASGPYLAGSQSPGPPPDWFALPEGLSRQALEAALIIVCTKSPLLEASPTDRLAVAAERETLLRQALVRLRQETQAAAETIASLGARLSETEAAWYEEATARSASDRLAEAARAAAVVESPLPVPPPLPASARRAAEDLADAVAALLPRLNLLRGSRGTLAFGFRNRASVLRAFRELHDRPSEVLTGWKMIRGAGSWRERHVSTGQDDSGRLYARLTPTGGVDVLLSSKASQDRDIAWLAEQ